MTASEPLSKEEVMLLVLSGASAQKRRELIQQRGISFRMSSDVVKELRELGADERLLNLLGGLAVPHNGSAAPGASSGEDGTLSYASVPNGVATEAGSALRSPDGTMDEYLVPNHIRLARPGEELIGRIIQKFVSNDQLFRKALTNYDYYQLVTVKQLNNKGKVVGVYSRGLDNVFDDGGNQISRETFTSRRSLKRISVSEDDARFFEQTLFTSEVRPDYDFQYVDHVHLDRLTAYVFCVRPNHIELGRRYFEGTIWVDDQDLQVVKVDGRRVPAIRTVENGVIRETLFPHFVEYRQQIDGKYWFPTVDYSDDTLQFAFGTVHVQVLVRYSNYRSFRAESHLVTTDSNAAVPQVPTHGYTRESAQQPVQQN